MFMNQNQITMQPTNQRTTYSRNALMSMRRNAAPHISIPSDILDRIQENTTPDNRPSVARRLDFDSVGRVALPSFFVNPAADINDNEVRYGSLDSETLER